MRFNIYGRFHVDVRRKHDAWAVYRCVSGKRALMHDLVVPPELVASEPLTYLDDIFHELATPGHKVELLAD